MLLLKKKRIHCPVSRLDATLAQEPRNPAPEDTRLLCRLWERDRCATSSPGTSYMFQLAHFTFPTQPRGFWWRKGQYWREPGGTRSTCENVGVGLTAMAGKEQTGRLLAAVAQQPDAGCRSPAASALRQPEPRPAAALGRRRQSSQDRARTTLSVQTRTSISTPSAPVSSQMLTWIPEALLLY